MVYDETMYKLRQLKLSGFVEALAMQSEDDGYHEMSFEQRLAILVDHEFAKRQSKSLERLVKNARFHNHQASLTEINYREDRKLDRNIILELGACNYIRHSQNVVILGATGAGKSFLAQGLGQAACQHRLSTRYTTLSEAVIHFMRTFRVVQISDRKWINLTRSSDFIKALARKTKLPLTNYFLQPSQLNRMLTHRL
ncbi:MAG TPA: ATP-binding protein [Clostridiaceae bacterium]|nr:ATP-binding protein [Clostridiaceae bacterium]